jgi:hypothetical protein
MSAADGRFALNSERGIYHVKNFKGRSNDRAG